MGKTSEIFLEIREKIQAQVNLAVEGEINPFELGRGISIIKKEIDNAKYQIDEAEKAEFEKYSKQELLEMKISMTGGNTWKFDHIPEWVELKNKLTEIEEKAKSAYRAYSKGDILVKNDTGEEIIPAKGIAKKQTIVYK
jgi:hypothetical protein